MEYTEGEQCSGQAYDPSGWGRSYQCTKKAVVERDGKSYCKIHDPEYIKAKQEAKEKKWDKEWAEKRAHFELADTAIRACKTINPSNPLAVATSIPDLYEALEIALGLLVALDTKATKEVADICRKAIAKTKVVTNETD